MSKSKKSFLVSIERDPGAPAWYSGLVGEIWEVVDIGIDYVVAEDYEDKSSMWRHIAKEDCHTLSKY